MSQSKLSLTVLSLHIRTSFKQLCIVDKSISGTESKNTLDLPSIKINHLEFIRFCNCTIKNVIFNLYDSITFIFDNCKLENVNFETQSHDPHDKQINIIDSSLLYCTFGQSYKDYTRFNIHNSTITSTVFRYVSTIHCNRSTFNACSFYDNNFTNSSIQNTTLSGCYFNNCNLTSIEYNNLSLDNCKYVDTLSPNSSCPQEGSYIAYKKANLTRTRFDYCLVKLLIPADAQRSSAFSHKCRASKAQVLDITSLDESQHYDKAYSLYDDTFIYEINKTLTIPNFNTNHFEECSTGIHHFINKQEAINY